MTAFYASFTNQFNRGSRGWFDELEQEVERAVFVLANAIAAELLRTYPNEIFRRLVRIARRSAGRVTVRRAPGDFNNIGGGGINASFPDFDA